MMMPSEQTSGEMEAKNKQITRHDTSNFAVLIKTAGMEPASLLSEFAESSRKKRKNTASTINIATNVPILWTRPYKCL